MSGTDFEPAALQRVLADSFGEEAEMALERIAGGQSNPTYFVTYGARRMVLRKQPRGPILRGAHASRRFTPPGCRYRHRCFTTTIRRRSARLST